MANIVTGWHENLVLCNRETYKKPELHGVGFRNDANIVDDRMTQLPDDVKYPTIRICIWKKDESVPPLVEWVREKPSEMLVDPNTIKPSVRFTQRFSQGACFEMCGKNASFQRETVESTIQHITGHMINADGGRFF